MIASIPSGLPINEASRLLAYMKTKYQPGYFHKCDIKRLCREYGKDPRTVKGHLKSLANDGLIGQDSKAIYLRSWKHITGLKGFNLQSFEASLKEIKQKEIFEGMLFGAKITSIEKAIRKGRGKVSAKGIHESKVFLPTGFLAKACQTSEGKVSKLKKSRFVKVSKAYEDHGAGTIQSVNIAKRENPGLFLRDGRLTKRKADQIESKIATYRIKNRKTKKQ